MIHTLPVNSLFGSHTADPFKIGFSSLFLHGPVGDDARARPSDHFHVGYILSTVTVLVLGSPALSPDAAPWPPS